jgi:hypothetical protein
MQDALEPLSIFLLNFAPLGEPGLFGFYWILQIGAVIVGFFFDLFGIGVGVVPV